MVYFASFYPTVYNLRYVPSVAVAPDLQCKGLSEQVLTVFPRAAQRFCQPSHVWTEMQKAEKAHSLRKGT